MSRKFAALPDTRGMNSSQKRMWLTLRFLVILLVLSIPLYLAIALGINLMPMQVAVAGQAGWILKSLGYDVTMDGPAMSVDSAGSSPFMFYINEDCTGWKSMLLLFALIASYPGVSLDRRLWGLVPGIAALWLVNLGRVVGVVLAERAYGFSTAMFIHDFGWQAGLIAAVLGIWIIWIIWAGRKKTTLWQRIARRWRA